MPAYLIIEGTITDDIKWAKYRRAVMPVISKAGGKHLTKGGGLETLEGAHHQRVIVLFEFPTFQAIRDFWTSPDYLLVKAIREGAADLQVYALPGAESTEPGGRTASGAVRVGSLDYSFAGRAN